MFKQSIQEMLAQSDNIMLDSRLKIMHGFKYIEADGVCKW